MMEWGYGMFGGIGMLLFWGVIIVLLVLLVRGFAGDWPLRARPDQSGPKALDILRERYAKGEISKEDYDERRRTLTQ